MPNIKLEPNGLNPSGLLNHQGGLIVGPGPGPTLSSNHNPGGIGGSGPVIAGSSSNNNNAISVINTSIISNNNGSGQGPGPGIERGQGPGNVGMVGGAIVGNASDIGADLPQKKFPCHLCRRSFMHKQSLDIHMRSHTGKIAMIIISLFFEMFTHLSMYIIEGERPYSCADCGQRYSYHLTNWYIYKLNIFISTSTKSTSAKISTMH
jgi:hypothetical protein